MTEFQPFCLSLLGYSHSSLGEVFIGGSLACAHSRSEVCATSHGHGLPERCVSFLQKWCGVSLWNGIGADNKMDKTAFSDAHCDGLCASCVVVSTTAFFRFIS